MYKEYFLLRWNGDDSPPVQIACGEFISETRAKNEFECLYDIWAGDWVIAAEDGRNIHTWGETPPDQITSASRKMARRMEEFTNMEALDIKKSEITVFTQDGWRDFDGNPVLNKECGSYEIKFPIAGRFSRMAQIEGSLDKDGNPTFAAPWIQSGITRAIIAQNIEEKIMLDFAAKVLTTGSRSDVITPLFNGK